MTQAEFIIKRFGTQERLAEAIGIGQSSVAAWKKRGFIPARQHDAILRAAKRDGVPLEAADFFGHDAPQRAA